MTLLLGTAFASGGAAERIDYADGSYAIITTVTGGITRGTVDDHKSIHIMTVMGQVFCLYAICYF